LIPYTRYVTRPFQQLLLSINQVALGDFQTPIPLPVQREFRLIAEAFNQMTARIQEHMQQKQRLLADVSHELRSPLARMRVSLDLLEREGQASEKYLHKLVKEVEQLDTLIDHLLDVSRLELDAGYQPRRISFDVWLQEWLDKNRLLIEEQRLHLRWHNEAQGRTARIDEALMERALNNLLSNVLKHAPPGSEVLMNLRVCEEQLVLEVGDQGPGVPVEELEKIFEPFYRSDTSRSRKTGGHGLGLAIVRKIILLHQGKIFAVRPPSGGFCMTIYLPIAT
jgi:signal transduction histidine kinase